MRRSGPTAHDGWIALRRWFGMGKPPQRSSRPASAGGLGQGERRLARLKPQIDLPLFHASIALILAACVPMALAPEAATAAVSGLYAWIAGNLGLLYLWMTVGAAVVLAVVAFGRHGHKRLGGAAAKPDFSTLSWMSMLFCAGIGASILYWSGVEWAYYLEASPLGAASGSDDARELAASYGIFHWGLSAWCLYCLPTVAIAWPYYQRRVPYLRLSTALAGLCGDDVANRPLGRAVDFMFIIALVGGTGTSLGLVMPMIAAAASALLGIEESLQLDIVIVFITVALFASSVYLGLDRGIRRFSDCNAAIAGAFALFVLVAGPTLFALNVGTNSLGLMAHNFVRMNTWTDPIANSGFVQDWTIFYWAWWLAYGPFMGLFVTRISRGRTLRQLIFGMVGFGTLGCALFFVTFGNASMWMDMQGIVPVRELVAAGKADTAIAEVVGALPLQPLPLIVFVVMAGIFTATTYDSASYAIAASATRNLPAGANPHRWHQVFWAFALVVLPITLMFVGGLRAIQSAVLVVSLPLLAVGVAITTSLFKSLRES